MRVSFCKQQHARRHTLGYSPSNRCGLKLLMKDETKITLVSLPRLRGTTIGLCACSTLRSSSTEREREKHVETKLRVGREIALLGNYTNTLPTANLYHTLQRF